MKIEMGESLLYSWLRHVKECQIVQTNWKVSQKWDLKNRDKIVELMEKSSQHFETKYGYSIYKNNSLEQLIMQAEVDVLGVAMDDDGNHIYAIDVAFHEAGLNYGSTDETVKRVIKKCIRTAMCIYGYMDIDGGEIIFASPKIHSAVITELEPKMTEINDLFELLGMKFKVRLIANEEFNGKILEPILLASDGIADTSELFLRSYQMYNMFANKKLKNTELKPTSTTPRKANKEFDTIEYNGLDGLAEMKIGVIVRTVLRKLLEEGKVPPEEIAKMQTKEYSRDTFHIDHPLLLVVSATNGTTQKKYYAPPLSIYGDTYFLCNDWFEGSANNDRPYLIKWLALYNK